MNYSNSRHSLLRTFGIAIITYAFGFSLVGASINAQSDKIDRNSNGDKKIIQTTAQQPIDEESSDENVIRPFRVNFPEAELTELRRRIKATRWPSHELVKDRSQGVQLATLRALAHYWATDYDWRKAEAKLNALPQFVTTIDGVDIHFIHVRSRHENALPLIMTHGWPGSVIELLEMAPCTGCPATRAIRREPVSWQ